MFASSRRMRHPPPLPLPHTTWHPPWSPLLSRTFKQFGPLLPIQSKVIGIYAGKATSPSAATNAYSMRLGSASLDPQYHWTWAVYLNDDRSKRIPNCRIWRDGTITATKVIPAHTELIIAYGAYYDWRLVDLHRYRRCLAFTQACLPVGSDDWFL